MHRKTRIQIFILHQSRTKYWQFRGAELEISKTSVSKTTSWVTSIFSRTDLEQRKTNLVNDLCREVGADILIDPQFTYSKRFLGGGKLTVRGYPARYKRFRTLSEEEIDSLIVNPKYDSDQIIFINKE